MALYSRNVTSGKSYKATTIVNYDSRVVPDLKIRLKGRNMGKFVVSTTLAS